MTPLQLILLDLDGTTVESQRGAMPSARVIAAVQKAQDAGIHVAVATGRPVEFARPVFEALQLKGLSVFNGGSELYDLTGDTLISRQTMTIAQVQKIVRLAMPFGFAVYTEDDKYQTPLSSPDSVQKPIAKVFIEAVANDKLAALLAELEGVSAIAPHPTTSWFEGDVVDVHITHALATKQHGVERLMKLLKIDRAHTMAIGDSYNDVPLFEAAGLTVAMGNAPDEVKAITDEVTATLAEDGVALAIERFALSDMPKG